MPERPWERVFRKEAGNLTVLSSFHHYGRRKRRVRERSCCDRQRKTHSEVSLLLKEAHPDRRGRSLRSVRRFCLKNGIHAFMAPSAINPIPAPRPVGTGERSQTFPPPAPRGYLCHLEWARLINSSAKNKN